MTTAAPPRRPTRARSPPTAYSPPHSIISPTSSQQPHSQEPSPMPIPILSQEWHLQLDLSLNVPGMQGKTLPPPVPPRRVGKHERATSLPSGVKPISLRLADAREKDAREKEESLARAAARPAAQTRPMSPEAPAKSRTGASLTNQPLLAIIPEDDLPPSLTLTPPASEPPTRPSTPSDPVPRPGSALSISHFQPVSTHDYPYAFLLSLPPPAGRGLGMGEEEVEERAWGRWEREGDERGWEEERERAFEWMRLKKVVRRARAGKKGGRKGKATERNGDDVSGMEEAKEE